MASAGAGGAQRIRDVMATSGKRASAAKGLHNWRCVECGWRMRKLRHKPHMYCCLGKLVRIKHRSRHEVTK